MQGVRHSPYKRNAFMTAVRKGNTERVREIISSRDLSCSQEWSDALDGYVLLLTALQNKHTDVVKLLLINGSKVNKNNSKPCNTPLHYAVRNGELEIVQMLLDRGANINVQSLKSKTALHIAVEDNRMDIIDILLNHGANVKISDISDVTPLHTAVKNDSVEIIKLLLSRGANVNATTCDRVGEDEGKGCTPLHLAVEKANEEIIKLLLSSGANVNDKRNDGIASLHIAIERGYFEVVKHLLDHGAHVNSTYSSATQQDCTPLHLAAELDAKEIVKLLLSKGADVNAQGNEGITPLHIATRAGYSNIVEHLLKYGANVHSTSQKGHIPLFLAIENRHEKVVELLVEHGACVDVNDKNNKSVLYRAVEKGNSIIVKHILKHSPNLNSKSNSSVLNIAVQGRGIEYSQIVKNLLEYGFTVTHKDANFMHAAIAKGYVEIVKELLKHSTDADMFYKGTSKKRCTPLHVATINGHEEVAKLLISYGADVNAPDRTGKTPMFYAIEKGDLKIFKLLLTNEVDVRNDPELLNIAVKGGHREIVEVLLQHGADVNASDEYGRMPLHFIILDKENKRFGFPVREGPRINAKGEIAKLLLSRGADVNTRLKDSMTVLHAAIDQGYVKVVEALLEYDADVTSTCKTHVTALHISAERGNEVITKMLLNKGANIHAKTTSGETALHCAIETNHKEVAELLLKCGADVNATTKHDLITPLHLAAEGGYQDIAQLLLDFGAKVDSTIEHDVTTSLYNAAEFGHLKIVKLLLKFGASVDSTNQKGLTALHIAVIKGHEEIITALLEHGSDITVKSKSHYTALDFAMDGIKLFRDLNFNSDYHRDYDSRDHDISTYINIAEILKRHMIKLKAANLNAQNDGILSIKSDDEELIECDYPSVEYEREIQRVYSKTARKVRRLSRNNFQNKCEKEIARMKSRKFVNTNISFYDILTKDVCRLAIYTRNESIVKAFGSGDYKKKFPIYANMLISNFRKGETKKELLEEGNKIFDLLFNDFPRLPRDCTERILSYLKNDDLRALTDAGKPNAHCHQS